jgi:hypothetical protein
MLCCAMPSSFGAEDGMDNECGPRTPEPSTARAPRSCYSAKYADLPSCLHLRCFACRLLPAWVPAWVYTYCMGMNDLD